MNRYQTFGSRFLAAIIDGIIVSMASQIIYYIIGQQYSDTIAYTLIESGLFYFYSIYSHYKFGQTLGKKITNVKVVSHEDETQLIGIVNSFKRDSIGIALSLTGILLKHLNFENSNFGRYLFLFSTFGWTLAEIVSMLFNKKRRAIHDFLANSVVIDVKEYSSAETNLLPKSS